MKSPNLKPLAATFFAVIFSHGTIGAQPLNDPAIHGMRNLPRVGGCLAPGGLQRITSAASATDSMFWCGAPPHCLTMPVGNVERCHINPGSRGVAGARGVRDPEDLTCDVAGIQPTGPAHTTPGRCPVAPTLGMSINGVVDATITRGAAATLRVNTSNPTVLSAPTSLTMTCAGAQAGLNPFNLTNLVAYAGLDQTFSPTTTTAVGNTSCTITATNAAGTVSASASFNVVAPTPAPTVSASFSPTNPTAGGSVRLTTVTTNATALSWSCSGRWTNSNTARAIGTVSTNHTATGSAGSADCVFTASGPGGTASATARWTSVASGGGGGSGSNPPPVIQDCASSRVRLRATRYECYTGRNYCDFSVPTLHNGASRSVNGVTGDYCGGGSEATTTLQCVNGSLVVRSLRCNMWDGGG